MNERIARLQKAVDQIKEIQAGLQARVAKDAAELDDLETQRDEAESTREHLETLLANLKAAAVEVQPLDAAQLAQLDQLAAKLDRKILRNEALNAGLSAVTDLIGTVNDIHDSLAGDNPTKPTG